MRSLADWPVRKYNRHRLKEIFRHSDLPLLAGILLISIAISVTVVIVILFYAAEYGFFDVPIASWVVLGLMGLLLFVDGLAFSLWRRLHRAEKSLAETKREPVAHSPSLFSADEIPVVDGFRYLNRPEFLVIVQTLFKAPPAVRLVQLSPLPGGYGGSTTLLAKVQYRESGLLLPHSFVVKLGSRSEILSEDKKFHGYVLGRLGRAARFLRHARLEDSAGIAYEFAGLGLGDIQSFYQLYQQYPAAKAAALIEEIYTPLEQAWYRQGQIEPVDPWHEYHLLFKKQDQILEQVDRLLDKDDPYRQKLSIPNSQPDPYLRPNFCPIANFPWRDPVDFLHDRPGSAVPLSLHRATIHGDLNAHNILFEIEQSEQHSLPWFIDFSHTGNGLSAERTTETARANIPVQAERGHTLRDFCRLEADVKFTLTPLENEYHLELALLFERELLLGGMELSESLSHKALAEPQFDKAWRVIRAIRRRATPYLANPADVRPYYWALLHATLPVVYYHPDQFAGKTYERQQKRYALMAAGMLCSRL